jgi:hypothetical protein
MNKITFLDGFCDPLGDKNVWGTLFSFADDSLTHNDVILATAKVRTRFIFKPVEIRQTFRTLCLHHFLPFCM